MPGTAMPDPAVAAQDDGRRGSGRREPGEGDEGALHRRQRTSPAALGRGSALSAVFGSAPMPPELDRASLGDVDPTAFEVLTWPDRSASGR